MSDDAAGNYLAELRAIARVQPRATAVIDDTGELTYEQLVDEVDARSSILLGAGLRPGDRVALVAENSASFLISAMAVWTARGVLATVYPSTAAEDLRYALENADPALILVDQVTVDAVRRAGPDGTPITRIDDARFEVPTVATGTMPGPSGLREDVFLICYSSGTTSRPKAIMLSQSAMYNGARTYADVWRLTSQDRTIVCLPMAWLFGLDSASMATLLVGGTVIALRRARPQVIARKIADHHATFLPAVTTIFAKLVEYLNTDGAADINIATLRLAVSGGEPRNEAAFGQFHQLAGIPVHDTYCASECFPLITYDPVADPEPVLGSAGKLVPHSELKIVDSHGNVVAPGETGEALSRGRGLMLGYWRDPDQTAQVLTSDGWYRTKDLVRMDADGYVYVVGRLSDMIIRGGSNVSPSEVERALRERPEIRDAVVVGLPDPVYGEEVAAAVVVAEGTTLDIDALRTGLSGLLAAYKLPTRVVSVPTLPVSSTTGKVDRRATRELLASEGANLA